MATYNGAKYIRQQIDSILKQLGESDELIISDDHSDDNTVDIVKSYNDPRIRLLQFDRSKAGLAASSLVTTNFENALNHAKGDFIFLADQDDVWTDDKVQTCMDYLRREQLDYVVSDCYITDSDLNIIKDTRFDGSLTRNRWKALIAPTPYQGSCAAFRRSVLAKALPFPPSLQSHDRWIGFIASFNFKYKIIPEKLVLYRRHNASISKSTSKSEAGVLKKISIRMNYIGNLLKRSLLNL